MRIAIDIMGGDNAPDVILNGCIAAVEYLEKNDKLVLVGDGDYINEALTDQGLQNDPHLEIFSTSEVIGMGDSPVESIKSKPDSSIVKLGWLGSRKAGEQRCDIVISAGNTGACVASAQMYMRRLRGVHRPGIAVTLPTMAGPVVICDVGANPEPRGLHLRQYAHMASIWSNKYHGIDNPSVAVLSIGSEEGKGNTLARDAHSLLKNDQNINYTGFIEGRDVFSGGANVVITEGFTGNVVLKLAEGLSRTLFETIATETFEHDPNLAIALQPVVEKIYRNHDYHEFGGAPLLGVNGACIICHGSSKTITIRNAIRNAIEYHKLGVNEAISDRLVTLKEPHGPADS